MSSTKPGYKTTEFWLTVAASLAGLLLSSGAVTNESVLQIIGGVTTMLGALGYTAVRGHVKASEIKSEALGSLAKMGKPE